MAQVYNLSSLRGQGRRIMRRTHSKIKSIKKDWRYISVVGHLPSIYKHNKALDSTSVLVPSHVTLGSQGPCLYCLCLQQVAYWANTGHWMLLAEDRVTNSYQIFTDCHELCMLSSPTHYGLHKVHLRNYDLHLANRTRHRENDEAPVPFLLCHQSFK